MINRNKERLRNFVDYISGLYEKSATTITFKVTEDCNLKCSYCYQTNKSKSVMNFNTAKKFIDDILSDKLDYINTSMYAGAVIEFIGGEPLLEIELIEKICDYWDKRIIELNHPWSGKYRFNICSNGVLYFDERVQNFLKKYHSVLSFGISLDGNKQLHDSCRVFPNGQGSYDVASKAVKYHIKNYDPYMSTKMTLAPQNLSYIYEAIVSMIEEIGYKEIYLNCAYEDIWKKEDEYILFSQLKQVADYLVNTDKYEDTYLSIFDEYGFRHTDNSNTQNYCGGNGSMIAVDYKGHIYPCIRYMESSLGFSQKPLKIGDIYSGIGESLVEKDALKSLTSVNRVSQSTQECLDCSINSNCGYCSALNYQTYGTVNKRTTFTCGMHKARALANVYYWNKVYLKENMSDVFPLNLPDEECLKIISKDELTELKSLLAR